VTLVTLSSKFSVFVPKSSALISGFVGKSTALLTSGAPTNSRSSLESSVYIDPAPPGVKLNSNLVSSFVVNFVFNTEFFNIATLYYGYDHVSGKHLKTLRLQHKASGSLFGIEVERVFSSFGIGSDSVANFYLKDALKSHATPNYHISFLYSGDVEDVTIGKKFRLDASHVPSPDGDWNEVICTSVSTSRRGGFVAVKALTKGPWSLVDQIITLSASSSKPGEGAVLSSEGSDTVLTIRESGPASPALPDMRVEINGIVKYTNSQGQVSFTLDPGTYTVTIQGTGYVATSYQIRVG
jgi:hypothetical protein